MHALQRKVSWSFIINTHKAHLACFKPATSISNRQVCKLTKKRLLVKRYATPFLRNNQMFNIAVLSKLSRVVSRLKWNYSGWKFLEQQQLIRICFQGPCIGDASRQREMMREGERQDVGVGRYAWPTPGKLFITPSCYQSLTSLLTHYHLTTLLNTMRDLWEFVL